MKTHLLRQPDFNQFLKVITRKGMPDHLPFYEHLASPGFIARRTGTAFDTMSLDDPGYWNIYVDFWVGMGFDCIRMEIPLNCPLKEIHDHKHSYGSETYAIIKTRDDFERYPWPDESEPIDFTHFETVAGIIPEGVKIVGGVCMGPYEWVSRLMGVMGLSYALADDPGLVECIFSRIGVLHRSAVRQLASMDAIGALSQGDDLGFKSSTFLSPADLKKLVFPIYKNMTGEAHDRGKPFILHSCGNLKEVYDDLITDCGIDAKHSFEDVILPVEDFKKQYGDRVTPLGGLDVDVICRAERDELRAYTRKKIESCFHDGYWALGTGNSLTDYMPVENYIAVLEEGMNIR
ncbi:uroporphyrinogen-III decarboxylase-like protein [bacterium]|nr:uroporphyrinogen-III decarboxylase-like protein [bacterium]